MHQSGKLQVQWSGVPVVRWQRAVDLGRDDGDALLPGEATLVGQSGGSGGDLPPGELGLRGRRGFNEAQEGDRVRIQGGRRGPCQAAAEGEDGGQTGTQRQSV